MCMHYYCGTIKLDGCNRLNICVPQQFICRNLILYVIVFGGGAFERWLSHECGALMNWIRVITNDSRELPCPIYQIRTQREDSHLCTKAGSLVDTKSASALILNLPASRAVRNKCWLFKPPGLQYFCYSSLDKGRQWR